MPNSNERKKIKRKYFYHGALLVIFPVVEILLLVAQSAQNFTFGIEERRWFLFCFPSLFFLIFSKMESWSKNSVWERLDKILIMTFVVIPLMGIVHQINNGGSELDKTTGMGVPGTIIFIYGLLHVPSVVYFIARGFLLLALSIISDFKEASRGSSC